MDTTEALTLRPTEAAHARDGGKLEKDDIEGGRLKTLRRENQ